MKFQEPAFYCRSCEKVIQEMRYLRSKAGIILIFFVALLVNIYFGYQKQGFHEDEYYTYFSSNRSIGLYQPDREWQDRQTILDEFAVKPGEDFNYGLVKLVQSWDVHPPFYYYIFHTICSFFQGSFTKWSGLITNLLAFTAAFFIFALLMKELEVDAALQYIILAFWALNPQTISCNLLIRMYAWLTVFVLACAYIHVRMVKEISDKGDELSIRKLALAGLLPLVIVSFLGFLTQYFYLFFFVPTGFAFAVWLFFMKKDIKKSVLYVASCAFSLGCAVLYYPASVHHMLGGYRGNEATESFLDIGNTTMRLSFFTGLLNDFVFAGCLYIIIIVIIVAIVVSMVMRRKGKDILEDSNTAIDTAYVIVAFGALCYFILTSKAGLLVGRASNRYEMPIYGLLTMLIFVLASKYLKRLDKLLYPLLAAAAVFMLVKGLLFADNVLFLYPEDVEKIQYARENSDETAVVMFNPATPHNVWRLTDEILEYDKVFYMDEENLSEITADELSNYGLSGTDKIILYAADDDLQDGSIKNLMDSCGMRNIKPLFVEDMWKSYVLTK